MSFTIPSRRLLRERRKLITNCQSPRDGRKIEYDYLLRCIEKLLVPSLDQNSDEMTYLTKAWSGPISKKVKEKANRFNDIGTWLSIEAVMRYVRQKLVSHVSVVSLVCPRAHLYSVK